jgi:hypothetical protein
VRHGPELGSREGGKAARPHPGGAAAVPEGRKTRNILRHHAFAPIRDAARTHAFERHQGIEDHMATRRHDQIIETPTEARQAEPGPSVLALLTVSTGLAVLILGVVWFVFFRT